jgi:hypothetical protein
VQGGARADPGIKLKITTANPASAMLNLDIVANQ